MFKYKTCRWYQTQEKNTRRFHKNTEAKKQQPHLKNVETCLETKLKIRRLRLTYLPTFYNFKFDSPKFHTIYYLSFVGLFLYIM